MLSKSIGTVFLSALLIALPLGATSQAFSWLEPGARAELDRLLTGLGRNLETLTQDLRTGKEIVQFHGGLLGGHWGLKRSYADPMTDPLRESWSSKFRLQHDEAGHRFIGTMESLLWGHLVQDWGRASESKKLDGLSKVTELAARARVELAETIQRLRQGRFEDEKDRYGALSLAERRECYRQLLRARKDLEALQKLAEGSAKGSGILYHGKKGLNGWRLEETLAMPLRERYEALRKYLSRVENEGDYHQAWHPATSLRLIASSRLAFDLFSPGAAGKRRAFENLKSRIDDGINDVKHQRNVMTRYLPDYATIEIEEYGYRSPYDRERFGGVKAGAGNRLGDGESREKLFGNRF